MLVPYCRHVSLGSLQVLTLGPALTKGSRAIVSDPFVLHVLISYKHITQPSKQHAFGPFSYFPPFPLFNKQKGLFVAFLRHSHVRSKWWSVSLKKNTHTTNKMPGNFHDITNNLRFMFR